MWKSLECSQNVQEMCSQTDRQPDFFQGWGLFGRLFVSEIYVIPYFEKVVRAIPDIYESCVDGQIDRQPDFLQGLDL